jgi:hypothetical protein
VLLSDLSRRFGNDFTVRGETSPEAALAALGEMAAANEPVALLLVDDAASDFLARAHELHPRAKRVASAVGEGGTVVRLVHEHLRDDEPERVAS